MLAIVGRERRPLWLVQGEGKGSSEGPADANHVRFCRQCKGIWILLKVQQKAFGVL